MIEVLIFGITIFLYLMLMWKAKNSFPILYLFIFTYFLQYVFSTYLIYNEYKVLGYQMPIKQYDYFNYVVPALVSLVIGLAIFNKDIDIKKYVRQIDAVEASRLGYLLLFISVFFDLFKILGLGAIDSIISFTTYLKYLAAFCFLFTRSVFNHLLIGVIYAYLGGIVLRSGVFISFFIWASFLFFFVSLKYNLPFIVRVLFFVLFIPVLILIQSVKQEYREQVWNQQTEGGLGLLSDLAEKRSAKEDEPFSQSTGVLRTVGRLSQGWHLGLTLRHVPKREPIANGKEMLSDIAASIMPRILFSKKKSVNSRDKFKQYTGHNLRDNTSMSIGVLGDFYINFGRTGSFIMLFIFGAFIAWILRLFTQRFVLTDPLNIIWIPFMLSYLIRANNDFYIFFNCLVKGFLIFLAINYIRYHIMGAQKPRGEVVKPTTT